MPQRSITMPARIPISPTSMPRMYPGSCGYALCRKLQKKMRGRNYGEYSRAGHFFRGRELRKSRKRNSSLVAAITPIANARNPTGKDVIDDIGGNSNPAAPTRQICCQSYRNATMKTHVGRSPSKMPTTEELKNSFERIPRKLNALYNRKPGRLCRAIQRLAAGEHQGDHQTCGQRTEQQLGQLRRHKAGIRLVCVITCADGVPIVLLASEKNRTATSAPSFSAAPQEVLVLAHQGNPQPKGPRPKGKP